MTSPQIPKLFISYSWSTPAHEQWVIDLATEISSSGVEVILDKWELREGHDSVAFMEKMVTDPSITKVLMICDQTYSSKADGRSGGVGTETQIISRNVYEGQSQDKFVAIVAEKDEAGKPYLPTYYTSRIYIDLSESDRYAEGFEKLLRWIFDKPLYVKPEIGKPPSFITDSATPVLGTSAIAKRVTEGLKNDKPYARGALEEYLSLFAHNLERFRLTGTVGEEDDRLVKCIEDFLPSRNEFLQVLTTLSQYGDTASYAPRLHRFFESLIPYLSRLPEVSQWNEADFDNYKFIIHELFLYALAILLRGEHFEAATLLLSQPYYVPGNSDHGKNATVTYAVFRDHLSLLQVRNKRLALHRLSLRADLLEQRSKSTGLSFQQVMQADFICFLRADLLHINHYDNWFPETLLYATRHYGPFEVFARSISKAYLGRVLPLLGVSNLAEVKKKLEGYAADRNSVPRWNFQSFSPTGLLGFEQLGTRA
jgi:SEFIR domain